MTLSIAVPVLDESEESSPSANFVPLLRLFGLNGWARNATILYITMTIKAGAALGSFSNISMIVTIPEFNNNPNDSSKLMLDSTSTSTRVSPVYRSPAGSSFLDPLSRSPSEGGSIAMTPPSPKSKFKELLPSSGLSSQFSSVDISVSNPPLVQPPPNAQQEHALTPPNPLSNASSSNSDINDFERLILLLSTFKDELQINSGIHISRMQAPVQPPPLGAASSLQSNHILHEKWCERCRKSFYGAQCDSHVSVYDADNTSENEGQGDSAPSLPLVSNDKSDPEVPTSESSIPPKNMLTSANASVIIQQFETSDHPPTCTIIPNGTHSKPCADHCAPSSSLSTSGHSDVPIIIHSSNFEGDNKFYHGHAQRTNRCHCHCQVSLLRSNSSSSGSLRASEVSDDDRLSCGCARRQMSRSPSPSTHRSHSKYRTISPVRSISRSPPTIVIPPAPLSPRFMNEPAWPHSEKYYFEDGTVVFRVGMLLYKVHRYFFDRYSTFFHDLFSTINLDARDIDGPIFLAEIEPHDFECLLSVFYPRSFDKSDLSAADWTSILSLSTRWSFADIRQSAVNHLAPNGIITAVEKIVLGTKYNVREWLAPAYEEVCLRARPLDLEEGARLGSERVVKIAKLRMEFGLEMGMASEGEPRGGGEARVRVPGDAPARIRQTFGLDLI